jgi:tryptophan synthase alpha chain
MLEALFHRAKGTFRAAFIPYVMAGDPDTETTEAVLLALSDAGADAIELGIPYGDPLADGPTIAAAGQRALAGGMDVRGVLQIVSRHRENGGAPIVLFSYFNPIYQYGIERFSHDASDAGASAVIVPDVALEESEELSVTLAEHGLDMPLLVAPSTKPGRAAKIAAASTGFIYVVARLGVTGAGSEPASAALRSQIGLLRGITDKPLAVGFGLSAPEHAAEVAHFADGVIVGSALIDTYAGLRGAEAAARVRVYAESLIAAARYAIA